jgi:hypothetical protein
VQFSCFGFSIGSVLQVLTEGMVMYWFDCKTRVRLSTGYLPVTVRGSSGPFLFVSCVSRSLFLFVMVEKKLLFKRKPSQVRGLRNALSFTRHLMQTTELGNIHGGLFLI